MTTYEEDINTIIKYLKAKNCAIWAHWDVSDKKEVVLAAEWLYNTMNEVKEFASQ